MESLGERLIAIFGSHQALIPLAVTAAAFIDGIILLGSFVNGVPLFIVAVYFLSRGEIGLYELIFFALLGALLGDHAGYWVGRSGGRKLLEWEPIKRRARTRERIYEWVDRFGIWGLVLGRFFSPTRSFAPFCAATFGMPYRRFAIGNLVACAAWVIVWSTVVLMVVKGYWKMTS